MRVRSLSATALAAASIFQPFAIAQPPAVEYGSVHAANVVQDAAASASTSSATTTHTVTMTVMRVVQTEYATRNSTATPSLTLTPFSNGTASVLGTGAGPSVTATESAVPMLPSGAASQLGLDVVGLVAAAGMFEAAGAVLGICGLAGSLAGWGFHLYVSYGFTVHGRAMIQWGRDDDCFAAFSAQDLVIV
ncbi:hypothetical protein LTR91_006825 [Friedmanniomyces endolithicus]|uniref:Uncharacterized protein n=1 Tax=Friedmanniomyces endolithicus TaxID=329885 RepID=A0AAN6KR21_9PEZI|nr:hypothetical protein LTR75_011371 [Friedmanniomyces endolithicus]KAK0840582.1 hypothetical protein LTR03_010495 [Friedmanniomyces endolithicus]KAK0856188.1 hypothetical protein LTS02_010716 [Friedmanniomyces endolithicus]KAK0870681.1 hypothetical protein LTR87_013170 [Friedmanniomyces endolithicus]KAK0901701.1 hypothetical protein LTR02_008521 [Friedmanniomyces endolithicus]